MLQPQVTITNRYRLQKLLRRGGMSEVYLAYDVETQQEVAIKLVSSEDPDCFKRLQREVRMLATLAHPHILPTLDHGEYEGWYYLVMPYMQRGTLRERLEEGQLTLEEVGEMLAQVADALQVAHEYGIVHRDIKPSNILLANDERFFYLADFGLAKRIEEGSDITQTGCLVGTPEYMAPEMTEKQESASSDIYALGILLYRMLAGQLPFRGGTPVALYWKHLHEQPIPPSYLNAIIPYPIERVILRALEKNPAHRYRTAGEMAAAYQRALTVAKAPGGVHNVAHELTPVHVEIKKTSEVRLPCPINLPERKALTASALTAWRKGLPWTRDFDSWNKSGEIKQRWQDGSVPTATRMALWGDRSRKAQKGVVASAAVLILLVLPLSLGFIVARGGNTSTLIAGASANVAATSLQPMHPYIPRPAASSVNTTRPTNYHSDTSVNNGPVVPPQKSHSHKHGHKHGKHRHKHAGD